MSMLDDALEQIAVLVTERVQLTRAAADLLATLPRCDRCRLPRDCRGRRDVVATHRAYYEIGAALCDPCADDLRAERGQVPHGLPPVELPTAPALRHLASIVGEDEIRAARSRART